jgi:hypothetical protein
MPVNTSRFQADSFTSRAATHIGIYHEKEGETPGSPEARLHVDRHLTLRREENRLLVESRVRLCNPRTWLLKHRCSYRVYCGIGQQGASPQIWRLTIRLSDAGLHQRQMKVLYPNHRFPPWLTEDAPRDRSNRLLDDAGAMPL